MDFGYDALFVVPQKLGPQNGAVHQVMLFGWTCEGLHYLNLVSHGISLENTLAGT